jgi:hypothetical protein
MRHRRSGFSLMEVMLATSILLGSSVVLIELAAIGRKQSDTAFQLNTAQLLCEAKLDEIVAGASPLKMVSEEELEDSPGWLYSVESQPMPKLGLVAVRVSVFQEQEESKRPVRFSLVRWLPDRVLKSADSILDTSNDSPRRGFSPGDSP